MSTNRSPSSNASSPDPVGQQGYGGRRSLIFFYYHNVTETLTPGGGYISATCNVCWMVLRGNKGVTSNFVSHLRRRHPSHYSVFVQCRAEQATCPDSTISPQIINIDNSPPESFCYEVDECSDPGQLHSEVNEMTNYAVDSTSVCVGDFRQPSISGSSLSLELPEVSRVSRTLVNRPEIGLNRLTTSITTVANTAPFLVPLTSCYTSPSTSHATTVKNLQPKQASIVQSATSDQVLPSNKDLGASKQDLVTRSVTKYVVQNLSSLRVVENHAFRDLIQDLHPGCSVVSEYDLRVNFLPEIVEKVEARIRDKLGKVENVSLSVNFGDADNGCGCYCAVSAYFTKECHLQSYLLTCEQGPRGDDLVADQICKYRLEGKIYKTIFDSCKSVSFRLLNHPTEKDDKEEEHLDGRLKEEGTVPCFERHLETVVQNALMGSPQVQAALVKATRAHEKIKRTRKIGLCCELSQSWNQDLKDIRRLLERPTSETEDISSSERRLLEELSSILEPFEEVMDMVRTEQSVPVSLALPSLVSLKKLVDYHLDSVDHLREVLLDIKKEMDMQLEYIAKDSMYAVAAFLDPRFKLSWCGDDVEERRALEMVRNAVGDDDPEKPRSQSKEREVVASSTEPPKKKIFLQLRHNTARKQSSVDEEVKTYLEEPLEDERTDPCRFWYERTRCLKPLPTLAKLSNKFLSVPSTSAVVTRIFGSLQADTGNLPDDLQKLLFLKANLSLWT